MVVTPASQPSRYKQYYDEYANLAQRPDGLPAWAVFGPTGQMPELHILPGEVFCRWNCDTTNDGQACGPSSPVDLCGDNRSFKNYGKLRRHVTQVHAPPEADLGFIIPLRSAGALPSSAIEAIHYQFYRLLQWSKQSPNQQLDIYNPIQVSKWPKDDRAKVSSTLFPHRGNLDTVGLKPQHRQIAHSVNNQASANLHDRVYKRLPPPLGKGGKLDRDTMRRVIRRPKNASCGPCKRNNKPCLTNYDICLWYRTIWLKKEDCSGTERVVDTDNEEESLSVHSAIIPDDSDQTGAGAVQSPIEQNDGATRDPEASSSDDEAVSSLNKQQSVSGPLTGTSFAAVRPKPRDQNRVARMLTQLL